MTIDPMTREQVEYFVGILENPKASPHLKALAEHLIKLYFGEGPEAAGKEWLRLRARTDLEAFALYVFGYRPAAHHREIVKILQDPRRKRTVIVAHPQSAKSTYVSLIYPCFEAGRDPDGSLILLTEAFTQAERYNSQIRPILKGQGETGARFKEVFPETTPDEDQGWTREKLYLANRTRAIPHPNLYFTGASSGAIQGSRASVILLDDVVSIDVVNSPTEMAKVRDRIEGVFIPRLYPDGRVICVMTRWAAHDLAEMFLQKLDFEMLYMPALSEEENGAYVDFIPSASYLRLPEAGEKAEEAQWEKHPDGEGYIQRQLEEVKAEAIADGYRAEITTSSANYDLPCVRKFLHDDNDPVLWPEYFTKAALEQRQSSNPINFRLVWNGDPTGVEGDLFKRDWFRTWGGEEDAFKRVPVDARIFMSVDVSVGDSKKGKGDYFVILVVAVDDYGNKFVIDMYRDKILPPYQRKEIKRLFEEKYPETLAILVETTNYQAALFHELAAEGLPVVPIKPIRKKELRIEAATVFFQQGKIFVPHNARWSHTFIDEHTEFPRGKHDDIIDAGSQLWEYLSTYNATPATMQVSFG